MKTITNTPKPYFGGYIVEERDRDRPFPRARVAQAETMIVPLEVQACTTSVPQVFAAITRSAQASYLACMSSSSDSMSDHDSMYSPVHGKLSPGPRIAGHA